MMNFYCNQTIQLHFCNTIYSSFSLDFLKTNFFNYVLLSRIAELHLFYRAGLLTILL